MCLPWNLFILLLCFLIWVFILVSSIYCINQGFWRYLIVYFYFFLDYCFFATSLYFFLANVSFLSCFWTRWSWISFKEASQLFFHFAIKFTYPFWIFSFTSASYVAIRFSNSLRFEFDQQAELQISFFFRFRLFFSLILNSTFRVLITLQFYMTLTSIVLSCLM